MEESAPLFEAEKLSSGVSHPDGSNRRNFLSKFCRINKSLLYDLVDVTKKGGGTLDIVQLGWRF